MVAYISLKDSWIFDGDSRPISMNFTTISLVVLSIFSSMLFIVLCCIRKPSSGQPLQAILIYIAMPIKVSIIPAFIHGFVILKIF